MLLIEFVAAGAFVSIDDVETFVVSSGGVAVELVYDPPSFELEFCWHPARSKIPVVVIRATMIFMGTIDWIGP